MKAFLLFTLLMCGTLLGSTPFAQAHEVYVLDEDEVATALAQPPVNPLAVVQDHLLEFIQWTVTIGVGVALVFFFFLAKPVQRIVDPVLLRVKHYAPGIMQITLGLALFASGWHGAAFGLELPFSETFGTFAFTMQVVFVLLGLGFMLGIYPRVMSIIAAGVLVPYVVQYGSYMLSYATYFGEVLTLILFGGSYALIKTKENRIERTIERHWHKYKFLVLRIFFGVSLIYASIYAKFIHSALAMETVVKYDLTQYFHFDPAFLVLGAMLTEILVGLCMIIGFEIRVTSIVLLVFLGLSMSFFGEALWPHVILIGTALAMFTHGYDKYTLSGYMNYRKDLEPLL